jgi:hypothetical protein
MAAGGLDLRRGWIRICHIDKFKIKFYFLRSEKQNPCHFPPFLADILSSALQH